MTQEELDALLNENILDEADEQEAKIEDCSRLYVATMKNKVLTKR